MVQIKLDRDMLVEELYSLRALIPTEINEANTKLMDIILLVQNAPVDTNQASYPKINGRRRG